MQWGRDTTDLMQSVTAQHLLSTGFLSLDLSHLCLHRHISRICHRSHLPAIMWKKHTKRAMRISSTLFLYSPPVLLTNGQTPMLKIISLIPHCKEANGKLLWASVDFAHWEWARRRWGVKAEQNTYPKTSAPQKASGPFSGQRPHSARSSPENCFTIQKYYLGKY